MLAFGARTFITLRTTTMAKDVLEKADGADLFDALHVPSPLLLFSRMCHIVLSIYNGMKRSGWVLF
jgi:hypothetical protein